MEQIKNLKMKKNILLLFTALTIFVLTAFNTNTPQLSSSSCLDQAVRIYNIAMNNTNGNHEYAWGQFNDYLDSCTNVVQLELQP